MTNPTTKDGKTIESVVDQIISICTDIYYDCSTIEKLDELTDKAIDIVEHLESHCSERELLSYINGRKDAKQDLSDFIAEEYVDTVTVEREAQLQAQSGSKEPND